MRAIPVKSEYGPTLDRVLAPWWRRTPLALRGALVLAVAAVVVVALVAIHALGDTTYSQRSPIAFHFRYRDLSRATPDPGGYVKVQSRSGARLDNSFEVLPLHLPPYRGLINGYLPEWSSRYVDQLRRKDADFDELGDGRVRVNSVPGYAVDYTERLDGQKINGRDVFLVPVVNGGRNGVVLRMLTRASDDITTASPVATTGPLHLALRSFRFG
jgi:hypothetical protein